jgi:hypothetical protein
LQAIGQRGPAKTFTALEGLVPHLVTALRVRQQFGDVELRARTAYAVLDQLDVGVVLTDTSARPWFVNARAEAIAAEADGFRLGSQGIMAGLAGRDEGSSTRHGSHGNHDHETVGAMGGTKDDPW